jgi:hypothetical protein
VDEDHCLNRLLTGSREGAVGSGSCDIRTIALSRSAGGGEIGTSRVSASLCPASLR